MNKEDILEKARRDNKDEREEQVNITAKKIGWVGVSAVMLFLFFWRAIHNESTSDILMILMAETGGASLYQYVKMPEKKVYLIGVIFSIIGLGFALLTLLSQYGVF